MKENNGWPSGYDSIEFIKKIENPFAECPKCGEELTEGYSDIIPGIFVDCAECGFSAYSNDEEKSFWLYKITEGKK